MTTLIIDEISCLAHNSHCEVYQNDFLDRDPISQKKKKGVFALRDLYDNGNTGEMLHS